MSGRGATLLGGSKAIIDPFMDNGKKQRISITIDNSYDRGYIPPFSLWAPCDMTTNPWKYMPYIPPIPIAASDDSTYYDIPNEWADYFRGGDEVISLDVSQIASSNLAFFGKQACSADTDIVSVTLGTESATIASVGLRDSGGTGYTRITMTDMLDTDTKPAEGAEGTGDVLVLAGPSTSVANKAYQEADRVVIMEQGFTFKTPVDGLADGSGGYVVESAVQSYDGRIDANYIRGFLNLNTFDASPALTACGKFTNGTRFNFDSYIHRG